MIKKLAAQLKKLFEDGRLSVERFNNYKSQLKELQTLKDNKKTYYNNRNKKAKKRG